MGRVKRLAASCQPTQQEQEPVTTVVAGRTPRTAAPHDPSAVEEVARFACQVRCESLDPAKNRARFSTITWQPALRGGGAIVRRWGRLGGPGRALTTFYPDRASAQESVKRLLCRRLDRGHRVVEWE